MHLAVQQETFKDRLRLKSRVLLNRVDVDRAVFFGLLGRIWSFCSGPVTAILISAKFTPELQGYHYTFGTILALRVFIELGLGTVIIQFASHEWSKLSLDESGYIIGDSDALSRLVSIANIASIWYFVGGLLVAIGLGIGGSIFFSTSPHSNISWFSPWILLCFVTGISVILVPFWSLLEGCNQVGRLYTFRFFQGLVSSMSLWIAILLGAKLWAIAISIIATLVCSLCFLKFRYWLFIKTLLLSKPDSSKIDWRLDMLPMQWRIAVSWISGYFIFSLFVPVLFKYHGPSVAGQMGMTWSIVGVMGGIAGSWLTPRAPKFGILIAQKKYDELDRFFWRITKTVVGISALMALGMWSVVLTLNILDFSVIQRFAARILSPLPTGIFLVAQVLSITTSPFSTYLRAHKREPLMLFSLICGVLVGCSTFFLGKQYSVMGMSVGYFAINLISVPVVILIWRRCCKEWHI